MSNGAEFRTNALVQDPCSCDRLFELIIPLLNNSSNAAWAATPFP